MVLSACVRRARVVSVLLLGFLLVSLSEAWALEGHDNVFERVLPNGLKIIVAVDKRSPTAAQMLFYRIGSIDEANGFTGLSHALEHMMFKGTEKIPEGDFSKRVAALGGHENAMTSQDFTVYHQQVHTQQLPIIMAMEADRMRHLKFDKADFERELQVVIEERRLRVEDKPRSRLYEQMMATIWQGHPYHHPVIGWMSDLDSMTLNDAKRWYHQWYAPNNATLVIAGDVDPDQVFSLAEKIYGGIKPHVLPERKPQVEPPQRGIRRVHLKAPAALPYLIMAWRAPSLNQSEVPEDPYALVILSGILDGGASARFSANLVRRDKIALDVDASYDWVSRGPAVFMIDATPAKAVSASQLELAIKQQISDLLTQGISADELRRVKAQVMAERVYKRDAVMERGMEMGVADMAGVSYVELLSNVHERLQSVTAEQVLAAAKRVFNDDQLTVAVLDPLPPDQAPAASPRKSGLSLRH